MVKKEAFTEFYCAQNIKITLLKMSFLNEKDTYSSVTFD
jgi:hypothetical protein